MKDFSPRRLLTREFMEFIAACGFAAVVNFVSRIVLSRFIAYAPAIVAAYLMGMATAFFLCKFFVFKAGVTGRAKQEGIAFVLVNMVAVLQTLGVSLLLADYLFPKTGWTFYPREVAHFVGICVPVFSSYFGHKYFSFGTSAKAPGRVPR